LHAECNVNIRMNYKNVLFDLGGVLIDIDVRRSLKAFAGLMGENSLVTAEGLMGGHTSELIDQYQIGAISSDEFVQTILSQCPSGTTRQQIEDAWNAMVVTMSEEKKALLHELIQQGKNVYVLSNTNDIHIRYTLAKWPELKQAKRLFFSHEMGMSKPDPRCYELVIRETGIRPEETVYVDDLLPNIEAGRKFGFQCLHAVDDGWMREL